MSFRITQVSPFVTNFLGNVGLSVETGKNMELQSYTWSRLILMTLIFGGEDLDGSQEAGLFGGPFGSHGYVCLGVTFFGRPISICDESVTPGFKNSIFTSRDLYDKNASMTFCPFDVWNQDK